MVDFCVLMVLDMLSLVSEGEREHPAWLVIHICSGTLLFPVSPRYKLFNNLPR